MENKKDMSVLFAIIVAIGIALGGFFIGSGIKYFKNFDRSVAVKGLSERIVKSDLVTWTISCSDSAEDLKQLNGKINNNQKEIKELRDSLGRVFKRVENIEHYQSNDGCPAHKADMKLSDEKRKGIY